MDTGDAPLLEVEQDNGAPAQPALRTRGAGGGSNDEDEWQMVTPGGSPRGSLGSTHTSLSSGAVSEHDSDCSESGAQAELNSLALADSILASREPPASDAPCHPPTPSPSVHGGDTRAFDAADCAAAPAGADDEGERGDADAAAAGEAASQAAAADGDYACPALDGVVAAVAACSSGAACALRGAGAAMETHLSVLSRWLVESVAMLAQSARGGGAAVHDALRAATARLLEVLPRTGKGGAGDVDWLTVLLASGAVSAAAAAVFLLHRNSLLRSALHQRDRELAKLVVRIMSLQEVLAGHHRHPVTRYTTTTTTTHAAFTGFAASMAYL